MGPKIIVFFDGVCGLCNRFIDFLIARDKHDHFRFSPLQSDYAKKALPPTLYGNSEEFKSVVVVHDGLILSKSNAALYALKHLGGIWLFVSFLKLIPKFFRDAVYDFIAKNRYNWFGKREVCRLPSQEERNKFIL